jgi:hypothetical protein
MTPTMKPISTLRQHTWTLDELKKAGFQYYMRRKQVVMAGRLPASAAPLKITYSTGEGYAQAGDVICYDPGTEVHRRLDEYTFWSVKPEIFKQVYRKWDEPNWTPTPPQAHLMRLGCRPYYKSAGIWARRLALPINIQSLESSVPALAPAGTWLAIGTEGEPWHIDDQTFRERYLVTEDRRFSGAGT